jgi:hypothetical protein
LEKITTGKPAKVLEGTELPDIDLLVGGDIGEGADLISMDMPEPDEYLSTRQKDGHTLGADELYKETWRWLKERGCEKFVSPRLLETYSQAFARYIQCEQAISQY